MAVLKRRSQKIELLRNVPLFSSLPNKQLDAVAKVADEAPASAGQALAVEGELGNAFYVIVVGEATVRRKGRKVASLAGGDFFGEMSLLDREPRSASVTMDTDGTVLEIHRREFSSLLDQSPALARGLLTGMSLRLRELDRKLYG